MSIGWTLLRSKERNAMSLLSKNTDLKVEQAFITSIDKVKGRVGLFLKNGLSSTGTYMYDINDLRVGISVLVSKVDGFYVIINRITSNSIKKSYGRLATFTIPDPNLEPIPPVIPEPEPEPETPLLPGDCMLILYFDGTDGGTDFAEEHGLQPILPLSIVNGDPMPLSEFCAIDYSRYASSPSSLKMFYRHPDWRDPAYVSPTRLSYDMGVNQGDFVGTFRLSVDQFDSGNQTIDFYLRGTGSAYVQTGFYKDGSNIIMYWYAGDADGTYVGGEEINVTSNFLMTSWNKLEWIVVGKTWTVKLNNVTVFSVDGISDHPFRGATILEITNNSEEVGCDFWIDTVSLCEDENQRFEDFDGTICANQEFSFYSYPTNHIYGLPQVNCSFNELWTLAGGALCFSRIHNNPDGHTGSLYQNVMWDSYAAGTPNVAFRAKYFKWKFNSLHLDFGTIDDDWTGAGISMIIQDKVSGTTKGFPGFATTLPYALNYHGDAFTSEYIGSDGPTTELVWDLDAAWGHEVIVDWFYIYTTQQKVGFGVTYCLDYIDFTTG